MTAAILIVIVVGILLIDLFLWGSGNETFSQVVIKWSTKYPIVPLLFGALIGHLWL